jgi:hypothetical protein
MNPIILELLIEEPIKLTPEGQQAVISAYDIAVKNGFVGTELDWLQTVQNIQSPITAEVLAAANAAAASAFASGASEQVAVEKAAEMIQLAQAVLALRNQAESLASASGSFATASGEFATDSNAAKVLSEAAKEISIEEAGKSSTFAGQSAASAAAAGASSSLITNKAEVNIVTAGNILRANGTVFKSISEVEFLQSKTPFERNYIAAVSPKSQNVFAWDNFSRPDTVSGAGNLESGQPWISLAGAPASILSNNLVLNSAANSNDIFVFERVAFSSTGSVRIYADIASSSNSGTRVCIARNLDNLLSVRVGYFANEVIVRLNGVETLVASFSFPVEFSSAMHRRGLPIIITLYAKGLSNGHLLNIVFPTLNGFNINVRSTAFNDFLTSIFPLNTDYRFIGINTLRVVANGGEISKILCQNL